MRSPLALFLLFTVFQLIAQNPNIQVLSEEKALSILDDKGLEYLESFTNPINLVYLNEANALTVIDKEFSTGLLQARRDSSGIYNYNTPSYTMEIATEFKNEYAAQKIFEFYQSLPKLIKSDTILYSFHNIDDILSILLFYFPNELENILIEDYVEWTKLAEKTKPKKYKTKKEMREERASIPFLERLKLKPEDLHIDCHFTAFQIAAALNKLGSDKFDDVFLTQLKQKQTFPFISNYTFPVFHDPDSDDYRNNRKIVKLDYNYASIEPLVQAPKKFVRLIQLNTNDFFGSQLTEILHNQKDKAIVFSTWSDGMDAYIIYLKNNELTIQPFWSINE